MIKVIPMPDNRKVLVQVSKLQLLQEKGIRKAFYFIGKDLVKESQKLIMMKPKHGKVYTIRRLGRRIKHRASAPLEAPANLTGALKKSIDFSVIDGDRMEFGVREYFPDRKGQPKGVDYGVYLELGKINRDGTRMAKRPYLLPSIVKNQKNAQQHFETQLKKSLENESI